jgi:XTP/dITP diphosphohydrolase
VKIYFLTTNPFKIAELEHYARWRRVTRRHRVELCVVKEDLKEVLDPDIGLIVRDKAIGAYARMGQPCVVEHGGIFMEALPGLPGSVGKVVWDAVGDRICGFLRADDSRDATVRSYLGYCDGHRVRVYQGATRGVIADRARGRYRFAWDPIFIPEAATLTYGQMGLAGKRHTSPVYRAWDAFFAKESARLSVPKAPSRR